MASAHARARAAPVPRWFPRPRRRASVVAARASAPGGETSPSVAAILWDCDNLSPTTDPCRAAVTARRLRDAASRLGGGALGGGDAAAPCRVVLFRAFGNPDTFARPDVVDALLRAGVEVIPTGDAPDAADIALGAHLTGFARARVPRLADRPSSPAPTLPHAEGHRARARPGRVRTPRRPERPRPRRSRARSRRRATRRARRERPRETSLRRRERANRRGRPRGCAGGHLGQRYRAVRTRREGARSSRKGERSLHHRVSTGYGRPPDG